MATVEVRERESCESLSLKGELVLLIALALITFIFILLIIKLAYYNDF